MKGSMIVNIKFQRQSNGTYLLFVGERSICPFEDDIQASIAVANLTLALRELGIKVEVR